MTKKDFELIAEILREQWDAQEGAGHSAGVSLVCQLGLNFAGALERTNPRFDRDRFLAACRGEDSTDSAGRKVSYAR